MLFQGKFNVMKIFILFKLCKELKIDVVSEENIKVYIFLKNSFYHIEINIIEG